MIEKGPFWGPGRGVSPNILADYRRAAVRAELGVELGPRTTDLTNRHVSRPDYCESLFSVSRLERRVIGVGDLARFAIELQLAQTFHSRTLRSHVCASRNRNRCDFGSEKRKKDVEE